MKTTTYYFLNVFGKIYKFIENGLKWRKCFNIPEHKIFSSKGKWRQFNQVFIVWRWETSLLKSLGGSKNLLMFRAHYSIQLQACNSRSLKKLDGPSLRVKKLQFIYLVIFRSLFNHTTRDLCLGLTSPM